MRPTVSLIAALAALALSGQPAIGQPSESPLPGAEILKYNNPGLLDNLAVGLWGNPIPVDYDGDGVKDLLMSCPDTPYRGLYFFRNIGSASEPLFGKGVKISSEGKNYIRVSEAGGKVRLLSPGVEYEDFLGKLYSDPRPIEYEGERIEMEGKRNNTWEYVDWDGDGDLDIIVGIDTWKEYGWDNAYNSKGEWTNGPLRGYVHIIENVDGKYINRGPLPLETYGAPNPCVADFDGDGLPDLICGEFTDALTWFKNIGIREKPVFAQGKRLKNKSGEIKAHVEMIVPVACDWDGDGHVDLLFGDEDGTVSWVRNTGKVKKGMPVFENPRYMIQKADEVKFGALSTPCSYDWDSDGKPDIISGNSAGDICLIRNLSGGANPVWGAPELFRVGRKPFRVMAGENGSIQGPAEKKWGYSVLTVSDIDGDGRPDIVINSIWGKIEWLRNKGSKDGLKLSKPKPIKVAWKGETPKPEWFWWIPKKGTLVTQWRTTPVMIDWTGDGLDDLVVLDQEGYLCLYERIPSKIAFKPGERVFYGTNCSLYKNNRGDLESGPGPLRLNDGTAGKSGRRKICFTDWDGDGRVDLIVDSRNACLFRNVRDEGGKTWFECQGNVSSAVLAGHSTCPTPVDWNGDGIPDLLIGAEDGHFYLVKNPR